MEDDITIRALPNLDDVTHYPMTSSKNPSSMNYLTSRRYPYNKTMLELAEDMKINEQVNDIMNSKSRSLRMSTPPPIASETYVPRVVETSYYPTAVSHYYALCDFQDIVFHHNGFLKMKFL